MFDVCQHCVVHSPLQPKNRLLMLLPLCCRAQIYVKVNVHEEMMTSIAFVPSNGRNLNRYFTLGLDRTMRVWSADTLRWLGTVDVGEHQPERPSAARALVSGFSSSCLLVWKAAA